MRLRDKVAIVTGIGAGIGEAIAVRFAMEGAKLALADIQEAPGNRTLAKVKASRRERRVREADISKEDSAREISAARSPVSAAIDILVNNAADFTQMGVEKAELSDWQRVLGVNVIGTALVAKFAIPHMKAGRIDRERRFDERVDRPARVRHLQRQQGRGDHHDQVHGARSWPHRIRVNQRVSRLHSDQRVLPGDCAARLTSSSGATRWRQCTC